jgi:hypothetical protein
MSSDTITNYNAKLPHFISKFDEYKAEKEYKKAIQNNPNVLKDLELRRLVMIYCSGVCQCCDTPEGETNTLYINDPMYNCDNMGYITCDKKECILTVEYHTKELFNTIYNTNIWKRVLYFAANNININVYRSNGRAETDWTIMSKNEKQMNNNLNEVFFTMLLCLKKLNAQLYDKMPSEILELIYNKCLYSYTNDICLIFTYELTPHIGVCKMIDNKLITKKLPLESF